MVAPLTPTNRQYTRWGTWTNPIYGQKQDVCIYAFLRKGFNQKPPYDIDTPLYVDIGRSISMPGGADAWNITPGTSDCAVEATNKAQAKFVNQLGDSSQLGATLTAEAKSSWTTVSGGITNALLAANAVRRGRLSEAAKILSFHPPVKVVKRSYRRKRRKDGTYSKRTLPVEVWVMPDGKHVAKSLGNKWLWYSYGVKPLCQDIYNGMDVLTRPTPDMKISASGAAGELVTVGGYYETRYVYKSSVRITASVRVDNPNLWLANKLGLINPVQMFIEGVRLSFVVDWFSNLSQIVNQMTDFVGLQITRPVTTSRHEVKVLERHPYYNVRMDRERIIIKRELVIPKARLRFAYERFHWQRGLNAISLLVQHLKR